MPKKLQKAIGIILLLVSVGGVSCGSVLNALHVDGARDGSLVERVK